MPTVIDEFKPKSKVPAMSPGDTVKVNLKIKEGEKERIQGFQGVVIRIRQGDAGGSFTVRRVAYGVGIERTFPMASPLVEKVEVIRHGKVRRAKLYYLRGLSAKKARIKEKRLGKGAVEALVTPPEQEITPVPAQETEAKKD
jgi:large subunit ribosomal protein L19